MCSTEHTKFGILFGILFQMPNFIKIGQELFESIDIKTAMLLDIMHDSWRKTPLGDSE